MAGSETLPVLSIIIPLIFAFGLPLVSFLHSRQLYRFIYLGSILTTTVTSLTAYIAWSTTLSVKMGGWHPAIGIELSGDGFSAVFLTINAFLILLLSMIAQKKLWGFHWRSYTILFLVSTAVNGIVLAGDIFNMFVFIEILSVCSYVLTGQSRKPISLEAGFKYLVQGTTGGMFLLVAISMLYMSTGTLNLSSMGQAVALLPTQTLLAIAGLTLTGMSLKIGVMPFHFWRPDAYTAVHTTICALMSGVIVKSYVFALMRISAAVFSDLMPRFFSAIAIIGCISIIGGHLMALMQDNIKRLLAYSTVAHLGYILVGISCDSVAGTVGATYHAFSHSLMKTGLFLISGVMIERSQKQLISEMSGLGRNVPHIGAIFAVLSAAIVGIPPFNGFVSKLMLTIAGLRSNMPVAALVMVFGTVVSASYYLRILSIIYSEGDAGFHCGRASVTATRYAAGLGFACLLSGLLPLLLLR